jgi:hypothetical protein
VPRLACSMNSLLSRKVGGAMVKFTGLSGEPAAPAPTVGSAISGQHVARANIQQAAPDYSLCHWTVRCAKGVVATKVGFTRKGRKL